MTETFYDVLEVDEDASQEEITEAYREKVKEYHPDVSDEPDAGEVFKKVVQAEEVLGDPDERAKYDDMGHGTYVRRVMESNQAGSEQSPWTTEDRRDRTHDAGFGGMGGGFGGDQTGRGAGSARGARSTSSSSSSSGSSSAGSSGSSGGASSYADSSVGFGKAAGRQAGADWTTGRSNNRWDHNVDPEDQRTAGTRAGATAGSTTGTTGTTGTAESDGAGYSVRDWDQADAGPDTVTVSITQEKAVLGVLMFFFYPVFIWFSISPGFPTVVNVVLGMCTLLSVGYFLTVPKIGIGVFGAWSVIAPVGVVVATDWGLGTSILAVAACWVPFGYSVVVAYFTMPD